MPQQHSPVQWTWPHPCSDKPKSRIPAGLTSGSFTQQGAGQDQDTQQDFQNGHPGAKWDKTPLPPDFASSRMNFPFCYCGLWILSLFYSIRLYKELLINLKLIQPPDNLPTMFSFMKLSSSIKNLINLAISEFLKSDVRYSFNDLNFNTLRYLS